MRKNAKFSRKKIFREKCEIVAKRFPHFVENPICHYSPFLQTLTFLAESPINPRIRMNPPSAERGTECPSISITWPTDIHIYVMKTSKKLNILVFFNVKEILETS